MQLNNLRDIERENLNQQQLLNSTKRSNLIRPNLNDSTSIPLAYLNRMDK